MTFENVAENLRESFRVIARNREAGEVRELPGVSIASAGATFEMFNAAFLNAPVEAPDELKRRIALAAVQFQARGLRWAFWVCDDMLSVRVRKAAKNIFEEAGLRHSVTLPGMVAEEVRAPVHPPPGIEVRRVSEGPTRDVFCAIGSTCFHVPLVWFREVFDSPEMWADFAAYVAYVNGEAVATTAVIYSSGAVGVYNVATLPAYQRRGYGEAVMRHALAEASARHGCTRTLLQSTPAGLRLYERMGYKSVARISVYAT